MSATRDHRTDDLSKCPCSGVTLDRLIQPAILSVLADAPLHGYGLAERIGRMPSFARQKPDVSGIYRFLKAMERQGLVVSCWDLSDGGPARKSYEITPAGQRCLRRWVATLEEHRVAVVALLKVARKAAQ